MAHSTTRGLLYTAPPEAESTERTPNAKADRANRGAVADD